MSPRSLFRVEKCPKRINILCSGAVREHVWQERNQRIFKDKSSSFFSFFFFFFFNFIKVYSLLLLVGGIVKGEKKLIKNYPIA